MPRTMLRTRQGARRPARRKAVPNVEQLEDRVVPSSGVGVFDPNTGTFSLHYQPSGGTPDAVFPLTATGSIPVVGDWNGDGRDDFGVFDPNTATWSLKYGATAGKPDAGVFQFGAPGTIPVVGDWNGDGRDDIGVFDPGTATWTLRYGAS